MRRLSRDTWLAIGILLTLVLVTIVAAITQVQGQEEKAPPLANFSSAPDGARALRLWLEELGYEVSDESSDAFAPPEDTGVMLILEPTTSISDDEWKTIDAWVSHGGTLVLAGDGPGAMSATQHYDFEVLSLEKKASALAVQTPLLASPPLTGTVSAQAQRYLHTYREDFVTHLAAGSRPVMVSLEHGSGRVILCTAPFPFSNAGLKEAGNPALALNVVTAAGRPDTSGRRPFIWFDEWHHGVRPRSVTSVGPEDWLRYTPSGRAMLYTAAVIFLALVLGGRRFGRPVPLPRHTVRRAPLEHITAIANLSRRAGHRQAVLNHYHQRLKRDLGKRYRLNPTLPDDEYVTRLAEFSPNLDAKALRSLLARLRRKHVSEKEMIQLAAEVADWLKK